MRPCANALVQTQRLLLPLERQRRIWDYYGSLLPLRAPLPAFKRGDDSDSLRQKGRRLRNLTAEGAAALLQPQVEALLRRRLLQRGCCADVAQFSPGCKFLLACIKASVLNLNDIRHVMVKHVPIIKIITYMRISNYMALHA
jgi:hypothetical protein